MPNKKQTKKLSRQERKKRNALRAATAAIILSVLAILSGTMAILLDTTRYVSYREVGEVDCGVTLKENDVFESEFLDERYEYIASLIDEVQATFRYKMATNATGDVSFEYGYRTEAALEIKGKDSGKLLYTHTDKLLNKSGSISGGGIGVDVPVSASYEEYNARAAEFFAEQHLTDARADLVLRLYVDVTSQSDEFRDGKHSNAYTASITIPLLVESASITNTSDEPVANGQILSYTTAPIAKVFYMIATISAVAAAILAVALILTASKHKKPMRSYDECVSAIFSSNRKYVERLSNHFDTDGYQILMLSEFGELLRIRKTIMSPILMDENDDRTCTRFIIPTLTNILYVYEVNIKDFDGVWAPSFEPFVNSDVSPDEAELRRIYGLKLPEEEATEPEVEETLPEVEEILPEVEETLPEVEETLPEAEEADPGADDELKVIIHADPDFSIIEPKNEPIKVDAPVSIDKNSGENGSHDPESTLTYGGELLFSEGINPDEVASAAEPAITLTYEGDVLFREGINPDEAASTADGAAEPAITLTYGGELLFSEGAKPKKEEQHYGPRIENLPSASITPTFDFKIRCGGETFDIKGD